MPPTSVNIFEEGAEIVSLKIVDGGMFDKKGLYEYMVDKPAQYPGSSGCRNIKDVESDLKAVGHSKVLLQCSFLTHTSKQIAANHKGVQLITARLSY
jgi:5-oxoprolinase (ATP-hydrolysing)